MERKPNNVNKCWLTYRDAVMASGIAEKTAKWYDRGQGRILIMCEVARPLSCNLKGGYHISCPFRYVGRGRVRVVTHGPNLPRHGTEAARSECGSYPARGACQNCRP
jgi:hypothetical protein